ncbi:hypothetical protein PTSG_07527 [Salpingoeca rosetta]|uniref:Uncharacterized protein n=1 Tax=Salpingoeca rosetta (strain ATCC 50818 / BSB-021) TaxID=946362 RepID=F2UH09_SALR5|nr:uncharacterized protein PTSG_07527 [Salpingoeca rosetta]EGD76408.1 hypothetical protein PTSG_07527 [Salpingoeca rosetta]|eukprot:XP_004991323.1 hypothetical protein PTSG_07527 [Salpingoeca rosetta]
MPASDHCETPREAYADIAPVVSAIAEMCGKTDDSVTIYDPYFCAGAMKQRLASCGFPNIINRNSDFYEDIRTNNIPEYDILITNPPYSTEPYNHIKRLMQFLADMGKPFFILQPVYVYTKPYYQAARERLGEGCFFITPSHRYRFETPQGMRNVRQQELITSPFVSLWYCYVPAHMFPKLRRWWCAEGHRLSQGCVMRAQSRNLPQKFKDSHDATRHRKRPKQRRAMQRRHDEKQQVEDEQQQAHGGGGGGGRGRGGVRAQHVNFKSSQQHHHDDDDDAWKHTTTANLNI